MDFIYIIISLFSNKLKLSSYNNSPHFNFSAKYNKFCELIAPPVIPVLLDIFLRRFSKPPMKNDDINKK